MENISKIVVSKNDGVIFGYVLDIVLDNFEKVGYIIVEEETENEYLLKRESILSISDEFVLIEDVSMFEFVAQKESSLIGLNVLSEEGFCFGQVVNLKFEKNKCVKIITKNCEILTKFIKKIGKNVIFVNFKKNKKKIQQNIFPKINDFQQEVKIQKIPEKINLSSKNFIGKVCGQDLFGYNNERIVVKGAVINKAIVEKARMHDKLNQLFFAIER